MQESPTSDVVVHFIKKEQFEEKIKEEFVEDMIKSEQFVEDGCVSECVQESTPVPYYYYCSECSYSTDDKKTFTQHVSTHQIEQNWIGYTMPDNFVSTHSKMNVGAFTKLSHVDKNLFECYVCGYRTDSKNALEQHVITHRSMDPLQHHLYNLGTNSKSHTLENVNIHNMVEPFTYRTCKSPSIKAHMEQNNMQIFKCDECDYWSSFKGNLKTHITLVHNRENMKYKCNMCNYSFNTKFGLEDHIRKHKGEQVFQCDMCNYRTHSKRSLARHIHTSNQFYNCDQCNFKACYKSSLVIHKKKHIEEKLFKCKMCSYHSTTKRNLIQHEKRHSNKPILDCPNCDFKTISKYMLHQHSSIHKNVKTFSGVKIELHIEQQENVKNFKCNLCEYTSSKKREVSKHMVRIHYRENLKYKCDQCKYAAESKSALDVHVRSHTGEKPFKCKMCSYSCTQKPDLKKHEERHDTLPTLDCPNCIFKTLSKIKLNKHYLVCNKLQSSVT